MKKQTEKNIVPMGASQCTPAEMARPGEAAIAINVRESESALIVTGHPAVVTTLTAGHRLLLVDNGRMLTLSGHDIMLGDTVIATADGEVVGAHRLGSIVVITTTTGIIWLQRTTDGYRTIALADACPDITLSALEWDEDSCGIEAITFDAPYAQWPTTLTASDVSRLSVQLRRAWNELQQNTDATGAYSGMMRVRCGVRLHDDSYLWLSQPVTLGLDTLQDSDPLTAEATLNGTQVTGITATTMTRHRYRLGITVLGGIADEWINLVKAVDILATPCIAPAIATGSAQYRTIGIGGSVRHPRLEFGLPALSQGIITDRITSAGWHVVASTADLTALNEHRWVSDAVATTSERVSEGITSYAVTRSLESTERLSATQAQAVEQSSAPLHPTHSTVCNGRLVCIDDEGMLTVSAIGNPLVNARQQVITGTTVRAILPLSRAIYSNGFGRYPLAIFTDEGIYALPQNNATVAYGEPRLLDRTIIAPGTLPVEGDRDIYFCSHRGHLCRLRGSEVAVMWHDRGQCQMAWDDLHHELWTLSADGAVMAMMPSGRMSVRTINATQLYNDVARALAVGSTGQVMDLTCEDPTGTQSAHWMSHPIVSPTPRQVIWLMSGEIEGALQVLGERGVSCHGFMVGQLRLMGAVNAPLRQRLVSQPLRSVRLRFTGTATCGTLILPAVIR